MFASYDYLKSLIRNPSQPAVGPSPFEIDTYTYLKSFLKPDANTAPMLGSTQDYNRTEDWVSGPNQSSKPPQYPTFEDWVGDPKPVYSPIPSDIPAWGSIKTPTAETALLPAVATQPKIPETDNPEAVRQFYLDGFKKYQSQQKLAGMSLADKIRDNWFNPDNKGSEYGSIKGLDDNEPDYGLHRDTTDIAINGENGYNQDEGE